MLDVNRTIDPGQELLRSAIGSVITSLDVVIVARDNVAWNTVRVNTTAGSFDVSNLVEELSVNGGGDVEGFGVLSVAEAATPTLEVDGVDRDASSRPVGEGVAGVTLVNGRVTTFDEGTAVVRRAYTQAIAFELQSGDLLVLDKGAWFGETVSVAMGTALGDLVYDDSADWEDDPEEPSIHFAWERGLVRI